MSKQVELVKKVFDAHESIKDEEWGELVEECKSIITESVTVVREAVIECKWKIGDTLFRIGEKRITSAMQSLAKDVHVAERDLWYCLAFRKKFHSLEDLWEKLPEGKNISWNKLITHYIDFSLPKPSIPVEEKFDEWGITDWWRNQHDLHVLKVKSKSGPFMLKIEPVKIHESEKKKLSERLSTIYTEVTNFYIGVKQWKKSDLGRGDYARIHKTIKLLLEKSNFDKEKVKDAIKWCFLKYKDSPQIDWTIETVLKKYPEAMKNHGKQIV